MDKFVVVADDLTGGNGTGVLLLKDGLKVLSAVNYETVSYIDLNSCDGVVVNTCSRGIPAPEAFERVYQVTSTMKASGVNCFCKRIDSTIRGNLGIEIEAALAALGDDFIAMVVPVWPETGRINVGGYLLVNGVPVQQTDAGSDAKTPVRSSSVAAVIAEQTALPIGSIGLNTVMAGAQTLAQNIRKEVSSGKRIIVFDAVTGTDIVNIAEAVCETGCKTVAVDPGPFSEALILRSFGKTQLGHTGKVMVVSGSATALTRAQLDYLEHENQARFVNVDVKRLLDEGLSQEQENEIALQVFALSQSTDVFGLRVAAEKQMLIDLASVAFDRGVTADFLAGKITSALGRIAHRVLLLNIPNLKGIYLTGGDMTVDFCEAMQVRAIELTGEVMPLAASGRLVGGEFEGLQVVTKGGLVGSTDGALKCIDYLLNR